MPICVRTRHAATAGMVGLGLATALVLTSCSNGLPTTVAVKKSGAPTVAASTSSSAPSSSAVATPSTTAHQPAQDAAAAAASATALVAGQAAGSVSVAAMNVATGATFSAGATSGMWTASAYKLLVLETLLLQRQASGGLSASQQRLAVPMIEQSDNADGYSLFEAAGGRSGLAAAVTSFGMTNTVIGRTDPTFTTTSGSDYLVLLRNLVAANSPLNAASRAYALSLMTNVEADQRWGVGAAADAGTTFANKNGWLSIDNSNGTGEDDNGLWAVTSVGVVTVLGQQLLLAVFTQHQSSMAAGVNLIQTLAKAAAPAVTS
jgi:beta-lactamase class A